MEITRNLRKEMFLNWRGYLVAIGLVVLATWLKYLAQPNIIAANIPITYMLAIVPTAIFFGLGPSILVCILSVLAYDFFFIPPLYQITFNVDEVPILVIFLMVGLVMSFLASNLREKNRIAASEITTRKQTEAELIRYRDHLEEMVKQRTSELEKANSDLNREIDDRKRIEGALRESDERWATTVGSIGDAVIATDTDGRITYLNAVAEILTGWTLRETKNQPVETVFNIINEHTRQKAANPVEKVLQQGIICGLANHTILIRKDGTEVAIDDSGSPIKTRDGNTTGVVLVFRDITERKKMEDDLHNALQRLTAHFENSPLAIIEFDPNYHITRWSAEAQRLFGWTAEEVLGKAIGEFRWVVEEDIDTVDKVSSEMLSGQNPRNMNVNRNYRKDGSIITCEWYNSALLDEHGNLVSVLSQVLDITERKKVEKELKESQGKLVEAQLIGQTGNWEWNIKTGEVKWSAGLYAIYRLNPDIFVPSITSFGDYIHHDDREYVNKKIDEVMSGSKSVNFDFRIVLADGSIRFLNTTGEITAYDKNGKPCLMVGVNQDITERKIAEEAIQASEERFKAIADNTPDHILVQDASLRYTFVVNPQAGLTEKDMLGKTDYDILAKEDAEKLSEIKRQVVATGKPFRLETPLVNKEGNLEYFSGSYVPKFNREGQTEGLIGYFQNVTERKKAEEELTQREQRFRVLIENLRSGVALIDELGQFSAYNSAFLRMFGLSEDASILNVNSQEWDNWKVFGADGKTLLPADEHPVRKAARTLQPVRNQLVGVRQPAGGNLIWMLINVEPISNQEGKIQYLVATYYDITERKQAEEELRESEERFRALANNIPQLTWMADGTGWIVWYNQKWYDYTGTNLEEMKGWGWQKVHHPDYVQPVTEKFKQHVATGEDWEDTFPLKGVDGNYRWFLSRAFPIRDNQGKVIRWFGTNTDITEKLKAEEDLKRYTTQLEATNKELESFSYSVSHDLRAPLRSLEGFSSALIEDYSDKLDAQGIQYLKYIQESSDLMAQLIDDLLKLSRVTRSEMDFEEVNLSELVDSILTQLAQAEPQRQVKATIAPDIMTQGDPNLLRLALENLLSNAWKFSSKNASAKIEVGTLKLKEKLTFFVRDNGVGFDMAYADKLFQPFQRLHKNSEFSGTGVGLATVQRIIRRHGGEVWAEGEVGKGTTVYFTLS